jgi:hypothetical protein
LVNTDQYDSDKPIASFKINDDFTIEERNKFHLLERTQGGDSVETAAKNEESDSEENKKNDNYRWSCDISNLYNKYDGYIVLIAISRINVNEDMKGTNESGNTSEQNNESKKRVAIYRIVLRSIVAKYYGVVKEICAIDSNYCNISGICRFIEDPNEDDTKTLHDSELRRFIILNFSGIYSFEFNKNYDYIDLSGKFGYPQNIRRELDNWYTNTDNDCMERLLSCIYSNYFLAAQYKNGVQSLEGKYLK